MILLRSKLCLVMIFSTKKSMMTDGPKYRFEMSRGFSSDSAESGYQRLFAHELQKSDMHPTPWLACDCMPGMKDSKLVSAHDFWKSEREARRKAAPKRSAGTERVSQAFPREAKYMGGDAFY